MREIAKLHREDVMTDTMTPTEHKRSISMTDSGPDMLAWVIGGFLHAEQQVVSGYQGDSGFLVVVGRRKGWYDFGTPDDNRCVLRMAKFMCDYMDGMETGLKPGWCKDTSHSDDKELTGWLAESETLEDGTPALRITPAYV